MFTKKVIVFERKQSYERSNVYSEMVSVIFIKKHQNNTTVKSTVLFKTNPTYYPDLAHSNLVLTKFKMKAKKVACCKREATQKWKKCINLVISELDLIINSKISKQLQQNKWIPNM